MGVVWKDEERFALWRAVSVFGRRWADIAGSTLAVPGRSHRALKQEWDRYAPLISGGLDPELSLPLVLGVGPRCRVLALHVPLMELGARSLGSGRPWEYVVNRTHLELAHVREPTPRQARLVACWKLGCTPSGGGRLLCNLKRAESMLLRYFAGHPEARDDVPIDYQPISVALRDSLGMVVYPGEVGATLTSNCAALNWLGGEVMAGGRFASAREVAGWMGISAKNGACEVAMGHYQDASLCQLLAESVHGRVADFGVRVGQVYCRAPIRFIGSMYSGALDELGAACARAFTGSVRSFVAESDESKSAVLREAYGPRRCFSSAEAIDGSHPADILVSSPPCLVFSRANRVSTAADQVEEATRQVAELERVVVLLAPKVVLLEQTAGLGSHCHAAYAIFTALWERLPYRVFHSRVDAHSDCGGFHYRERLIWVAVREDVCGL